MLRADLIDRLMAGSGPETAIDGEITYLFYGDTGMVPLRPYTESIDACIGLMREVLPGWSFVCMAEDGVAHVDLVSPHAKGYRRGGGDHSDCCRAWLIAILQAMDARDAG